MNKNDIVVIAVDVGSHEEGAKGKEATFAWYESPEKNGQSLVKLKERLKDVLKSDKKVALGFEAPIFIPWWKEGEGLSHRDFEKFIEAGKTKVRGWYYQGGSAVLAQLIALLNALLNDDVILEELARGITFNPDAWEREKKILIWEAFISGGKNSSKEQHLKDAEAAVKGFLKCYNCKSGFFYGTVNGVECICPSGGDYLNLFALILLSRGFDEARKFLSEPCLVIKMTKP